MKWTSPHKTGNRRYGKKKYFFTTIKHTNPTLTLVHDQYYHSEEFADTNDYYTLLKKPSKK